MKVGLVLPVTGEQATRENITQVAKDAENEGRYFTCFLFNCNSAKLDILTRIRLKFQIHLFLLVISIDMSSLILISEFRIALLFLYPINREKSMTKSR